MDKHHRGSGPVALGQVKLDMGLKQRAQFAETALLNVDGILVIPPAAAGAERQQQSQGDKKVAARCFHAEAIQSISFHRAQILNQREPWCHSSRESNLALAGRACAGAGSGYWYTLRRPMFNHRGIRTDVC